MAGKDAEDPFLLRFKKMSAPVRVVYARPRTFIAFAIGIVACLLMPHSLRLVTRLGIGGYPDFQKRLREEVTHHMNSPVNRTEQGARELAEQPVFQTAVSERVGLLEQLATSAPPSEFDLAVEALARRPKQVAVMGGYFSRFPAQLFAAELDLVARSACADADR